MGDIALAIIATANVVNAILMSALQIQFLREQNRLSRNYLRFYEEQRQFYRDVFRTRTEEAVRLAAQDPVFTPNYQASYTSAYRIGVSINYVNFGILNFGRSPLLHDSYYDRRGQMYGLAKPYNTDIASYINCELALTQVDIENHLYRYEEYKENIYSQRRWDRLNVVAEFSNKNAVAVAQDGATSFGFLNSALEAKGNMYGAASNDLFASAGNAFQSMGKSGMGKPYKSASTKDMVLSNTPANTSKAYSNRMEQEMNRQYWTSPTHRVLK